MSSKLEGTSSGGKRERNQNIQVYVRVLPLTGSVPLVIDTPGTREVVVRERTVANITKTFTFDRVFDCNSTQQEVYRNVVAPLLKEVLLGYNCTVFAYGQTGTGKTYTMEGELQDKKGSSSYLAGAQPPICESAHAGILPRALSQLFDEVRKMDCEFQVRASFLELYNEELCDLLATVDPNQSKKILRIYEDSARKGSVVIQGLEEVIVQNKQEVYDVLTRGSQMRKTASTNMNHSSSRSHTVFTITVHMKESSVDGEEMVKVGKLHLVDLAGSENIGKSGAVDKRAREAGSINQSLLTLGRVISALVERTPHVPYRESKLTRLLQDSLGGKTKTSIIATISPATAHIEETLSTLDYAHRAKNIMNKPEVNQRLTKREALNIYTEEIERLRKDLMAARDGAGFFIDLTNYNNMQNQIASMNLELIEKCNHVQSLKDTIEERDKELNLEAMKNMELEEDIAVKDKLLDNANVSNMQLKARLTCTLDKVDELQHLLKAHTETEKKLAGEAGVLLQTTNDTVKTIESLHARLDRKKKVEETNLKHTDRFRKDLDKLLNDAEISLEKIKERNVLQTLDYFKLEDERKPLRKILVDECHTVVSSTFNACMRLNTQFTDVIEKLENGISHATADSNMNFMLSMDSSKKNATDMKDSLVDMLQAMKTQFGSMKAEINKLKTLIAKEFDNFEEEIKSTLSKDMAEFARLETVMVNLMSSFKTMAEHFDENSRCFDLRQQKYQDRYQQKIAGMQKTLQELLADSDEYVGGSAEFQKKLVDKFSTSRVDCDTVLADEVKALQVAKTVPEATDRKLAYYRERNVSSHQEHLTHLHDKVDERIQSTRQLEKKVNSVVTAQNEMLQDHLTYVKGHNEKINKELKSFIDNTNPCTAALQKTCEHSRGAFHKMLSNVAHTESLFISELRMSVDNQLETLSEGLDQTANDIRKINGFQNEFWDTNYLKDLPTGATPMRREYQYPTKLSATSPNERVLSRYRSVSKRIRDTLVEHDSADSDSSSTEVCVSQDEDYGKNFEEERERLKREAEVLERDEEEKRQQRLEWEEQERQRLFLHKKTQVKLKKGVPFNEVLQDLTRVKSPQEEIKEKYMDALMEKEGEIDLNDKSVTKCEIPRESFLDPVQSRPLSDGALYETSKEKENAVPASKPAAPVHSKKRRKSGGNKKKTRSK